MDFWSSKLRNLAFCNQEGVAIEIAEAVVGALKGELAATAVNAPMVPAEVSSYFCITLSVEIYPLLLVQMDNHLFCSHKKIYLWVIC